MYNQHCTTAPMDQSTPIRPLPRITGQLDNEAVLRDLGIEASLWNIRSVALGKSLVASVHVTLRGDMTYRVCTDRETGWTERVSVGISGVYCSCKEWRSHHCIKHDYDFADPDWLCPHGAAVLLRLGRSQTYSDWESLQRLGRSSQTKLLNKRSVHNAHEPKSETPDHGHNRRAFYAVLGKNHLHKLAGVGLDFDMVVEGYRRRFGVVSLSQINEQSWAIAAAEMQAAVKDKSLLEQKAAELKSYLLGGAA